jgi:transcriptional antiterminator RfaH
LITSTRYWQVVHTKPRQEKALALDLAEAGIEFFLPLVKHRRTYGHRRRTVEMPLFSGYLFLHGDHDAAWTAFRTTRTVRMIRVVDQLRFEHELNQIRQAVEGEATLDAYPFICKGKRVRITSGPFEGIEGQVDDRLKSDRIILIVHSIGQAASLEIDAATLEPID